MNGSRVQRPERFSGIWEAEDGSGGAVGLHLILQTKTQLVEEVSAGIYHRHGSEHQMMDGNYFISGPTAGKDRRITLRWHSGLARDPAIDLDLTYEETNQSWRGFFHRGEFAKEVVLRRPAPVRGTAPSLLAGTWASVALGINGCVHIVQQPDGNFAGWSDDLASAVIYESYGDLVKVQATSKNALVIEFKAFTGVCCAHFFAGTLSPDGSVIIGNWRAGSNQTEVSAEWRRVDGESCAPGRD